MMSDWSGFTEEELQKLKQENTPKSLQVIKHQKKNRNENSIAPVDVKKRSIPQWPKQVNSSNVVSPSSNAVSCVVVSPSDVQHNEVNSIKENASFHVNDSKEKKIESIELSSNQPNAVKNTEAELSDKNEDIGILTQEKALELERSKIEQLQIQQKLIEDQNKKKKQLIASTLQERMKQTISESQKLKEVQQQLNHLDEKLQVDVETLRNKIEEASLLFSQAEKRYERSEVEYVAAKCDYFKKKEQKEQLVEQLYSVIQANEERKARKLEELMVKLVSNTNLESPKFLATPNISNETSNTNLTSS